MKKLSAFLCIVSFIVISTFACAGHAGQPHAKPDFRAIACAAYDDVRDFYPAARAYALASADPKIHDPFAQIDAIAPELDAKITAACKGEPVSIDWSSAAPLLIRVGNIIRTLRAQHVI